MNCVAPGPVLRTRPQKSIPGVAGAPITRRAGIPISGTLKSAGFRPAERTLMMTSLDFGGGGVRTEYCNFMFFSRPPDVPVYIQAFMLSGWASAMGGGCVELILASLVLTVGNWQRTPPRLFLFFFFETFCVQVVPLKDSLCAE